MRCKNCGIEISDEEIFCDICKKELKSISSKKELNELEQLINESELEKTKELDNLKVLISNELNENIDNMSDNTLQKITREEKNKEIFDDEFQIQKPKSKKIIIIIFCIIFLLILICITTFFISKDLKKEEIIEKIDYETIINTYGKRTEKEVKKYINENSAIPIWEDINEKVNYNAYKVVCETHDIYEDGSIYLNNCKVDNKKVNYYYGILKEEEKTEISIYKVNNNENSYYINQNVNNSSLVGTITCSSSDCEFINGYDKYSIILENNEYYIYNHELDELEFGPFSVDNGSYYNNILFDNNTLYGVYYNNQNSSNIYNISKHKIIKNIKGKYVYDNMAFSTSILYKYNLVVFENNNYYNFINLNTGNVSFTTGKNIGIFLEDSKNKIVYITCFDEGDESEFVVYSSKGKLLFDGKKFNNIKLVTAGLLVSNSNKFYVYDEKLNIKVESNHYDKIINIYDNYIIVVDDDILKAVDFNNKQLNEFDNWDMDYSSVDSLVSQWENN